MLENNEELIYSKSFNFNDLSLEAKELLLKSKNNGLSNQNLIQLQEAYDQEINDLKNTHFISKFGYKYVGSLNNFKIIPSTLSWITSILGTTIGLLMIYLFGTGAIINIVTFNSIDISAGFFINFTIKLLFSIAGFVYALNSMDKFISNMFFKIVGAEFELRISYLNSFKIIKKQIDLPEFLEVVKSEKYTSLIYNDGISIELFKGRSKYHEIVLNNLLTHFKNHLNPKLH